MCTYGFARCVKTAPAVRKDASDDSVSSGDTRAIYKQNGKRESFSKDHSVLAC
jgi:hypothetical protein